MIFSFPVLKPGEAAAMIEHGQTVGFSGFTPAGAPKAIPLAIAKQAEFEHQAGRDFQIGVLTGASTGPSLDGALAKAAAISFRTPYQSDPDCANASTPARQILRHASLADAAGCAIRILGACALGGCGSVRHHRGRRNRSDISVWARRRRSANGRSHSDRTESQPSPYAARHARYLRARGSAPPPRDSIYAPAIGSARR